MQDANFLQLQEELHPFLFGRNWHYKKFDAIEKKMNAITSARVKKFCEKIEGKNLYYIVYELGKRAFYKIFF